jgi:hypothetical protein
MERLPFRVNQGISGYLAGIGLVESLSSAKRSAALSLCLLLWLLTAEPRI